jgi:hypothetical protein
MADETEVFSRNCEVEDAKGVVRPLVVTFYGPIKNPNGDDYLARANIACSFFEKDVYGSGEDAPQAFFWLPIVVVSYLIGQRRAGFEAYWSEKGDLDYRDFWAYRR